MKKWEAVSEDKKEVLPEEASKKLKVISIKHWPPRLVYYDRNVVITAKIDVKEETSVYLYIREEKEKSGLRYLLVDTIQEIGKHPLKFQLDMGSDNLTMMGSANLTSIQNAELYILDSDGKKASAKPGEELMPYKFEVTFVEDYVGMIGVLGTVTAVVVALLSLWAQLYARLVDRKCERSKKLATLNLFWIYIAIFIALLGLISFLSAFSPGIRITPKIMPLYFVGWGLLVSSIAMVVLSVFESIVAVFVKGVFRGATAFDPSFIVSDTRFESYYKCSFAVLIFLALWLCMVLLWLIASEFSCLLPKVILIILLGVAYIGISIRYSR